MNNSIIHDSEATALDLSNHELLTDIRFLLIQARHSLVQTVNTVMVQTYWQIGRLIVEHEQSGNARAEYGKQQLAHLSSALSKEFGKGFDVSNLRNMRRFYQAFPIQETLSLELSWSHYYLVPKLQFIGIYTTSPKSAKREL